MRSRSEPGRIAPRRRGRPASGDDAPRRGGCAVNGGARVDVRHAAAGLALGCAATLAVPTARADPAVVDASYGRVQGDLTLVGGLGATLGEGGARAEAELRVRYLESVGLFGAYEDGPLVAASPDPRRALVGGLEVRPLFLYRWLQGLESRRAWLDLAIDSLGLDLGAVAAQPAGQGFASQAGVQAGVGLELPLLADASGPFLRVSAGLRWSDGALATGVSHGAGDRQAFVTLSLAWHQVIVAHVVDVGDEAPR